MKSPIRLTMELIALTIAAVSEGASAISCYQCIYTDTALEVTSTCTGSLSGSQSPLGRCSGSICRTRWAEYSSPSNSHRDHECIEGGDGGGGGGGGSVLPPTSVDRCEGKTKNNETYFVYDDQCCFTSGEVVDYGARYMVTECFCQRDFCNAALSSPLTDSSALASAAATATGEWTTTTTASMKNTFSSANQSTTTVPVHLYYTSLANDTNSSSSSSSSWPLAAGVSTSVVHLTLIVTFFFFVFWRL